MKKFVAFIKNLFICKTSNKINQTHQNDFTPSPTVTFEEPGKAKKRKSKKNETIG
jgi:hypothetical protein